MKMTQLYILFLVMIIVAMGFIAVPIIKDRSRSMKVCVIIFILVSIFSLGLYSLTGDKLGLQQWLAQGQKHYQVQQEVDRMGGVDGLIKSIEKKLNANPQDAEGWMILGKLYLHKHDDAAAQACFKRAKELSR